VPSPSALRFLLPPDLMKLGQAYVEGHLLVEGPILEYSGWRKVSLEEPLPAGAKDCGVFAPRPQARP